MLNDNIKELACKGRLNNERHSWIYLSRARNVFDAGRLVASDQRQIFLPGHIGICLDG